MKFSGRDALLRVRDSKPNTDAEHRVPIESGYSPNQFFDSSPLRVRFVRNCHCRWAEREKECPQSSVSLLRRTNSPARCYLPKSCELDRS